MSLLSAPEVRARVATAARMVTPTWPLTSFIAVNPLAGHEKRPMRELATALGEAPTRSEADYLADYRAGAIPPRALRTAVVQQLPELAGAGELIVGDRTADVVGVAIEGMLESQPERSSSARESVDDARTPLDQYLASALARFYADPVWAPPSAGPLYSRFRTLVGHDRSLPGRVRRAVAQLPESPEEAIAAVVHHPAGTGTELECILAAQLAALPGWTSHLAWRATHVGDATLTDFVACRLALASAVDLPVTGAETPQAPSAEVDPDWVARVARAAVGAADDGARAAVRRILVHLDAATRAMVWQVAAETAFRDRLLGVLGTGAQTTVRDASVPEMQLVFCIDTRSEGMRRHLEQSPGVETLGFAGFFGVPLRHTAFAAQEAREQYPALLSGGYATGEHAVHPDAAERALSATAARNAARATLKDAATVPAAAFSWAEISGWAGILSGLVRRQRPANGVETVVDAVDAIPLDDQVGLAEAALRMMGLVRFAPLVVLTGHRSATANNLYRAALDCGACGGNPGGANARAAAAIFNSPAVRDRLRRRGLTIPDSTWFVAAEHETTTDRLTVLDEHLVPTSHRDQVARLVALAAQAADDLTRERSVDLPEAGPRAPLTRVRRRSTDWSEMYPELGLANNAALIIAPRAISRGADLQRRVFLHDYDAAVDPDGTALENIMTAPMVVAQWINAQYYFSTIRPERYGAGNKTVHNPVGDIGVLAGHTGDLRTGLPWQSVAAGDRLLHTPLRLSVLIQAPLDRIGRIISGNDLLRALLDGEWISLHARAAADDAWRRYTRYGFTNDERISR